MPIRELRGTRTKIGVKDEQVARLASIPKRMSCYRCGGFLVKDWVVSLSNDGGDVEVLTHRCIQCGEVIDPVVLHNRCSTIGQLRGKVRAMPRKMSFSHN